MEMNTELREGLVLAVWVPSTFWDDHSERCPCDGDPDSEMAWEVRRAGKRVLINGTPDQIEVLRSDAEFYADGNVDECTRLVRSAAATIRAIAKATSRSA